MVHCTDGLCVSSHPQHFQGIGVCCHDISCSGVHLWIYLRLVLKLSSAWRLQGLLYDGAAQRDDKTGSSGTHKEAHMGLCSSHGTTQTQPDMLN